MNISTPCARAARISALANEDGNHERHEAHEKVSSRFHPEARAELEEAFEFYQERRVSLGEDFVSFVLFVVAQ